MSDCEANVWKPAVACEKAFPGADPTLIDDTGAIFIGTEDTDFPHTVEGPSSSQAKADTSTVATKKLNPLGGDVEIGGEGSSVKSWNTTTGELERTLTDNDRFFRLGISITLVAHTVNSTDIGFNKELANPAAITFTINNNSTNNVKEGDVASYFVTGAVGVVAINAIESQSLVAPAGGIAVPLGRSFTLQYLGNNFWLYVGP